MIQSFRCEETEKIFNRGKSKKVPSEIQRTALRKLGQIHSSVHLNELRVPPGNRLEELKGDREGEHSIRINDQWRICFRWLDGNAYDVEIVDYHC